MIDGKIIAKQIYDKIFFRLNIEEENEPNYIAYRLLRAIEWGSPDICLTSSIASEVVKMDLPKESISIIKKYFGI